MEQFLILYNADARYRNCDIIAVPGNMKYPEKQNGGLSRN